MKAFAQTQTSSTHNTLPPSCSPTREEGREGVDNGSMKETWDERMAARYARVSMVYLLFDIGDCRDDCTYSLQ